MTYIEISTKINDAIVACLQEGAKTDEILAVLSVQREVWSVRLAQAMLQPFPAPDTTDKDAE